MVSNGTPVLIDGFDDEEDDEDDDGFDDDEHSLSNETEVEVKLVVSNGTPGLIDRWLCHCPQSLQRNPTNGPKKFLQFDSTLNVALVS